MKKYYFMLTNGAIFVGEPLVVFGPSTASKWTGQMLYPLAMSVSDMLVRPSDVIAEWREPDPGGDDPNPIPSPSVDDSLPWEL